MPDPAPKTRGHLSRQRILEAAIAHADAHGLAALSMRKLAEALDVEAMSLYNHVANKSDLLDGMVDMVIGRIALPAPGLGWKAALRARALSARETLHAHPWAIALIVARINALPNMLRQIEAVLACLIAAGFSPPLADRIANAIDSHVYGFTLQETDFPLRPEDYAEAARRYMPRLQTGEFPHLRALAEAVAEGAYDGRADFTFGLDILLDGFERLLKAKSIPQI